MVMPKVESIGALPTAYPAADASRRVPAAVVTGERTPPPPGLAELATPRPLALAGEAGPR
jgi:hypothetical protein